jgi:hypothetical protein
MDAIRPVFFGPIGEPTVDLNMGAGQDEYTTLPVTSIRRVSSDGSAPYFVSLSRWVLTPEERQQIADGADIVHQVLHTIGAYPPMNIQVCDHDKHPAIVS